MATFVDRVVVHVTAGDGGHGCASVHREKFKPLGGPDGGNGGRGGSVVLVVDPALNTLLDFHRHPHQRAERGRPGQGGHRAGASGGDLVLPVPASHSPINRFEQRTADALSSLPGRGGEMTALLIRFITTFLWNKINYTNKRCCRIAYPFLNSAFMIIPAIWGFSFKRLVQ